MNLSPDEKKKTANVAMQAEFLNEAEDIDNVPVDIVVGVPSFRVRETPSPLVLEATMRNLLQQSAPAMMNQPMLMTQQAGFSNSAFDARSGERHGRGRNPDSGEEQLVLPTDLEASGTQDLFVYSLAKLKLRRDNAAMPILTADVPYRDLYTWDVHETRSDIEIRPWHEHKSLQISENRVWRSLF